jgi:hypothetical protein
MLPVALMLEQHLIRYRVAFIQLSADGQLLYLASLTTPPGTGVLQALPCLIAAIYAVMP